VQLKKRKNPVQQTAGQARLHEVLDYNSLFTIHYLLFAVFCYPLIISFRDLQCFEIDSFTMAGFLDILV
jgi:hypothetical protein